MQWLRGFYYVALTGSLSAASKHMGINRAAVRHHLVKLEEELGCSLFDRSVDPMKLTEEGKKLLYGTETLFNVANDIFENLLNNKNYIHGTINIFTQQYISLFVIKDIIREFLEKYPDVSFNIQTGTQGRALRHLESRRSDLAICSEPSNTDSYNFEELFQERHVLCCLKKKFSLSFPPLQQELNDIPFIVFHSDAAQPTSNEIFTMMNINPRKIISIDSDLLALEYVKLGLGAAFLRERQCFNDRDILDIISFDSLPLTTRIGFLNLKNVYISPLIQLFKNFCKERLNVFSQ